jgi:hypothetical protein
MESVTATRNPRVKELQKRLTQVRTNLNKDMNNTQRKRLLQAEAELEQAIASMRLNGRGNTYRSFSSLKENETSFLKKLGKSGAARMLGAYQPQTLLLGAKQLAELEQVKKRFPRRARAIGVRFLQTQVRQRRGAVMTANGQLKKWACPTTVSDKTFLASGRISCVDARLHSAITQEYNAAKSTLTGQGAAPKNAKARARNGLRSAIKMAKEQQRNQREAAAARAAVANKASTVKKPKEKNLLLNIRKIDSPMAGVNDKEVPLRTVFGDRLVKRNIVLHSFLDTLSDALLNLNPNVRMNPTASRLRNAMKSTYHPFHRRFEQSGGDWKAYPDTFGQNSLRYTEPAVEGLAWSPQVGSFGTSGPQPYWVQLLRELYDAQRVINVRYKVRLDSKRDDGPRLKNVEGPLFRAYVSKALRLIEQPLPGGSTAMADNLGVTAAGYIMRSPATPNSPWIKSYHRFGRDWYVDDYDAAAKYQLPFGAYREDFYDPTLSASGPQKGLLDVYLNQIVTHLTNTEVGCRYGHVGTGGISELQPSELFKVLERVRGKNGFYELREKGKETVSSYGAEAGVEQGRAGPDVTWELANGCGMIYGTRSDDYFGTTSKAKSVKDVAKGIQSGTIFNPSVPEAWSQRSAELFSRDIRLLSAKGLLQQRSRRNNSAEIRARRAARRAQIDELMNAQKNLTYENAVAKTAGIAPKQRGDNRVVMSRFGNSLNGNLTGRVDQTVVVFPVAGQNSRLKAGLTLEGIKQHMRTSTSKPGMWYPSAEIVRLRTTAADSASPMYFTGHDMKYEFLKKYGFGLTSIDEKENNRSAASMRQANRDKLIESLLLVDGEIHSMSEYPDKLPVRFAGNPSVLSSSQKQNDALVSRRLPLVSNPIPGQDPSRRAREMAQGMAELLHADAKSGYRGLKKRLRENLVLPLFEGRMILKYFHFHDLLMRFMRITNSTRMDTFESVVKLMDAPETGDMMDCILFYILCYTGIPEKQAARKLQVMYAMRKTRQGREALMKTIQDLRLLGDNGPMSKTLFTRIAKHLLATQSEALRGRLSVKNVKNEVDVLRKNVGRKNIRRRLARTFGLYKNARSNFGMKNTMTTDQLLKQQYSGRLALRERAQGAKLAVTDAGGSVFGPRGRLRGKNATRGPAR